jgi:hypothetical protein
MIRALALAAALLAAAATAVSMPRGAAQPAQSPAQSAAAPACVAVADYTTYASRSTRHTITVTTTACGYDLGNGYFDNDPVWVELGTPAGGTLLLRGFVGSQDGVTFTKSLTMDRTDPPGRWTVDDVVIHDANDSWHEFYGAGAFYVRRNTHVTLTAAPTTVRPGQLVTLTGRLTRLAASGHYVAAAGREIRVQFRLEFSRAWQDRAELPGGTRADGSFSKALTAVRSGSFRACYPGGSWMEPSCGSIAVSVNLAS